MSSKTQRIQILLIEDNENDYVLTRRLLDKAFPGDGYALDWVNSYPAAIDASQQHHYDIYLIDYRLDDKDGLELAQALNPQNTDTPPIIILSGSRNGNLQLNIKAIELGVTDCIFKDQLTAPLLERAIRYSIARKHTELALRKSESLHRVLLDNIADGIITSDQDGKIVSFNPAAEKMFGYSAEEIIGQGLNILMPEPYQSEHKDYLNHYSRTGETHIIGAVRELTGRRKNGEIFPLELHISQLKIGNRILFSGILRDITRRKKAEEELRLAAITFESHTAIMITNPKGDILRVNRAFTESTGYPAREIMGKNPRIFHSGKQNNEFYQKMWGTIKAQGYWEGEIWNKRKNGEIFPQFLTITAVTNTEKELTHYVATFQDITERKNAQSLIEHQALYDTLTDLPNRRLLVERLQQELSGAVRRNNVGALLFLDLDYFKKLNDSLGHAAGDYLLQQVAKRLIASVRSEDTVARLGGDEFVVLIPQIDNKFDKANILLKNIAEKIRNVIAEPYIIKGHEYNSSTSIGVALFPIGNESADDILKNADMAMYKAKEEGRNKVCFYHPRMQAFADDGPKIENNLGRTTKNNSS